MRRSSSQAGSPALHQFQNINYWVSTDGCAGHRPSGRFNHKLKRRAGTGGPFVSLGRTRSVALLGAPARWAPQLRHYRGPGPAPARDPLCSQRRLCCWKRGKLDSRGWCARKRMPALLWELPALQSRRCRATVAGALESGALAHLQGSGGSPRSPPPHTPADLRRGSPAACSHTSLPATDDFTLPAAWRDGSAARSTKLPEGVVRVENTRPCTCAPQKGTADSLQVRADSVLCAERWGFNWAIHKGTAVTASRASTHHKGTTEDSHGLLPKTWSACEAGEQRGRRSTLLQMQAASARGTARTCAMQLQVQGLPAGAR